MAIVKVNRTPVSLLWTAQANSGTSAANQGIWLESSNSIAFSIPFAIVGYVREEDASTYLYYYSRDGLRNVLDNEGRNKVMQTVAEVSNSLPLDQLIEQYTAINVKIREIIIPYFKERGITITAVGIAGYGQYRDEDIATAIDNVFAAQQLKAVEQAKSNVATKHQLVMEKEGLAEAAFARANSDGPARAQEIKAAAQQEADTAIGQAKADAIKTVNAALQDAGKSETFLRVMQLDINAQQVARWNGQSPQIVSGDNQFVPENLSK
jgi:regulator of protease activity HflC (stomatin/prohibitin superfamily)